MYVPEKLRSVAGEALQELERATKLHGAMHGGHEGYAVILEELDELWDEIKKNPKKMDAVERGFWERKRREEAIQVAAMALRFVVDVCDT